jgi:hypothetical protein
MKPITPFAISAPGFSGLNLQDSPVDMASSFALQANNCVIDKSGRIASRKGWTRAHPTNVALGATATIDALGSVLGLGGIETILAAGNNQLFKIAGSALVTLTYGGGGVAPTITASDWKIVNLGGIAIFWQTGHDPLIYDPVVSTTTYRRLAEQTGFAGTMFQCNEALSAYGRIWAADTAVDKSTVIFSDVLTTHIWTGGTAGSIDVRKVWPTGSDAIVALASHNGFLYIFGRRSILIYSGATNPATMALADTIVGIGCVARDSVQMTGEDIIFLSDTGVRSLLRTIQEKSQPMRALTRNVLEEVQSHVSVANLAKVKSAYSPSNGFYLICFPAADETYCLDMMRPLQDGSARVTTWTSITPTAMYESRDRKLYLGKAGVVGQYGGYLDDTATYRIAYYTTWMDFGNQIMTSILKKVIITVIGSVNQVIVAKWAYDFSNVYFSEATTIPGSVTPSEYGIAKYNINEYSPGTTFTTAAFQGSSSGKVLQFGFEAVVNGAAVSIQKIELFTKDGRL